MNDIPYGSYILLVDFFVQLQTFINNLDGLVFDITVRKLINDDNFKKYSTSVQPDNFYSSITEDDYLDYNNFFKTHNILDIMLNT